jgi:flagellar biosynthesis protein FlhF
MRKSFEAVRAAMSEAETKNQGAETVAATLASAGLGTGLAAEITAGVRQRLRKAGSSVEGCSSALREELAARLNFSPELGRRGSRSVVALVGPPGGGKTTSLVKLAVRYGLTSRRPVHIASAAGSRVGGADSLRIYAAAMGVPFDAVETADALSRLLESIEGNRLILIDTPGFAPADIAASDSLATLLSGHPEADVHLVLNSALAPPSMAAAASHFRRFLPSKIIATNADISESLLPVVGLALELERPVSFIGTGQSVPEDLSEATADLLLGSLARGRSEAQRAAGAA